MGLDFGKKKKKKTPTQIREPVRFVVLLPSLTSRSSEEAPALETAGILSGANFLSNPLGGPR